MGAVSGAALWTPASSHHVVNTARACVTTAAGGIAASTQTQALGLGSELNQGAPVLHATPELQSDGDGSSHASLFFLVVFCCVIFGVRHVRRQQNLRTGYEV